MKTTKTSEAIAERMRKRGYDRQHLSCFKGVGYQLTVCRSLDWDDKVCAHGKTATIVYRIVEQNWKEKQVP